MKIVQIHENRYEIENDRGRMIGEVLVNEDYLELIAYGEIFGEVESVEDSLEIMKEREAKLIKDLEYYKKGLEELHEAYEIVTLPRVRLILNKEIDRIGIYISELSDILRGEFE